MIGRPWTEASVAVPVSWGELVAEELAAWAGGRPAGVEHRGTAITARAWRPADEPGDDAQGELARRLTELARRTGCDELSALRPSFRNLADRDWDQSWMEHWRPFRVGHIALVPEGTTPTLRADDLALRIAPGRAFGTGLHATTRTCLRALQQRIQPGQRLVDAGCGSGILAVAALLLGADEVTAFDVDIEAVRHTERLAREHGVQDRLVLAVGDLTLLGAINRRVDGLLANIEDRVLAPGAPRLASCLRPGAWFVLGGCRADREDKVAPALAQAGLNVERVVTCGKWRSHQGQRPA